MKTLVLELTYKSIHEKVQAEAYQKFIKTLTAGNAGIKNIKFRYHMENTKPTLN